MISAVLSIIIVNMAYKLWMTIIGANVMFFSRKTKIAWYIVVGLVLFSLIGM